MDFELKSKLTFYDKWMIFLWQQMNLLNEGNRIILRQEMDRQMSGIKFVSLSTFKPKCIF